MRVLVAEDEAVPRFLLEQALAEWGHEVLAVADGHDAWRDLQAPDGPKLAVLDWMMPGLDGPEVCRRLRATAVAEPVYVLLLTARDARIDCVAGLQAGANDYVTKPFDRDELRARLEVGRTVVALQASLAARVRELELALAQVKQLRGLLPICCYCKKVRDDSDYWQQVEEYVTARSEARFSHGICPDCLRDVVGPQLHAAGIPQVPGAPP